ncbi:MAG: glycosyltransferase family 4 protein [Caldilineaceae bacterium]|nr:glycosyltransferase family 4 protein [Caldilineaceae bacterium]
MTPSIEGAQPQMHRVALLTLDFPPSIGGVQQYLLELSRRIGTHYDLTVVRPRAGSSQFLTEPFRVLPVPSAMPWHFARALATIRPHLTIVGHAHPRLLLPAALLRTGRYIALAFGNDFEAAQVKWHGRIFNRLLAGASPLVTISGANARRLQELGLSTPEIVLPAADPKRFAPAPAGRPGPPVLLTVARLISRKGIDTVLRALPPLLELAPRLEYWIVGNGPARPALEKLARDLRIVSAVRFLSQEGAPISDSELPDIYRRASIFVLPARAEFQSAEGSPSVEGFGIVYLEASASGLPVVAARSRGASEAVRDGETGLLVPPDDPAALTQALARLLCDDDLCRRLGRAGRRWVEHEMNWDRVGRQFISIIERTR